MKRISILGFSLNIDMASKTNNRYHLIFVTKYRRKVLVPKIAEVVKEIISKEIEIRSGSLIAITIDDQDHIHIMLELRPNISISKFVQLLKKRSVWDIWENDVFARLLRGYYWSGNRALWSSGYFCSTTGDASDETIKKYIESQGELISP